MPPRNRARVRQQKRAAPGPTRAAEPSAIVKRMKNDEGKIVEKVVFLPNERMPSIIGRVLRSVEGHRYARRPSYIAKKQGFRDITKVAWADEYDQPSTWAESEPMPEENAMADCRWQPGPAQRALPAFKGPKPGPKDPSLTKDSPPAAFLDTQLTLDFKQKMVQYTKEHCKRWRLEHKDTWRKDNVECSMRKYKSQMTTHAFDLWLACKVRVAQLKPEISANSLWSQKSSLFDPQVFAAMSIHQYLWLNRHCSFASSEEPAADDEETVEERAHDTHRKRRELTDLACAAMGSAWNPHQFLGLDEGVREHKHWGKQRISWKAACHSGSLVDCLNDCVTKYCLWFEEQHWLSRAHGSVDPHSLIERLKRACQVLCDTGK